MTIAKGGFPWIGSAFILACFFCSLTLISLKDIHLIFLFFCLVFWLLFVILLVFFRDPDRTTGKGIVAVADGKIREISKENDTDIGPCIKISTFMNIHNVHVNRMPLEGTITKLVHHSGAHLPAFRKESERNERVVITAHTRIGPIKIFLIAGTIARRIVPYIQEGEKMQKGSKIGLIRLGSRVDVLLPEKHLKSLNVTYHKRIRAGVDTIAEIND
jgi:phosphatidylserine decarboxylase